MRAKVVVQFGLKVGGRTREALVGGLAPPNLSSATLPASLTATMKTVYNLALIKPMRNARASSLWSRAAAIEINRYAR